MELEIMTCLLVGQYVCPEVLGNCVWRSCPPLPSCPVAQAGCGRGGNAGIIWCFSLAVLDMC